MKELISILGAGESGIGAALLAQAKGYEVFVSDKGEISQKYKTQLEKNNILFEENKHTKETLLLSKWVVKSPGIPDNTEIVKELEKKKIPVISEIEFAYKFTKAKFIVITGSNGKTTTTLLTYHLLKNLGLNVGLAGNIGDSLAKQVIEDNKDYFVLELSSFQLDGMFEFKADVAVLLNITPDHLDRYEYKFQNYVNSKLRVLQNMTEKDYFISFIDDEVILNELSSKQLKPFFLSVSLKDKVINGAYLSGDNILVNVNNTQSKIFNISNKDIPLNGKHNLVNAMSAILVAVALHQDEKKIPIALQGFKNASHRLEHVAEINEVTFINDSKATNVDSVWYALDSMTKPVILLLGGQDKGNDYTKIQKLVKNKVKAIVCLGKDNSKILQFFSDLSALKNTHDIKIAVKEAFSLAVPGDVVLLSPACASFDLFKNYEDRGNRFKDEVMLLAKEFDHSVSK